MVVHGIEKQYQFIMMNKPPSNFISEEGILVNKKGLIILQLVFMG